MMRIPTASNSQERAPKKPKPNPHLKYRQLQRISTKRAPQSWSPRKRHENVHLGHLLLQHLRTERNRSGGEGAQGIAGIRTSYRMSRLYHRLRSRRNENQRRMDLRRLRRAKSRTWRLRHNPRNPLLQSHHEHKLWINHLTQSKSRYPSLTHR